MSELLEKRCIPCEGGISALSQKEIQDKLDEISGWSTEVNGINKITRTFYFDDFYQNIAFINAIAWIIHQENHHPYLEVEFNRCTVKYWTHAIGNLTENDFICAKKINLLYADKN